MTRLVVTGVLVMLALSPSTKLPVVEAGPEIYNVDSFTDSPSANVDDLACESVAGGCTLRTAIQEANTDTEEQTIILPPGTFDLSIAGVGEDSTATGDLDITEDLTIIGGGFEQTGPAGADETIIDAGALDRAFHVLPDTSVTLIGVTITGGLAPEGEPGGGIWNRGTLRLEHVVVTGNSTSLNNDSDHTSGGVSNQQGFLTILDSTISNNQSVRGGGIFNAGASTMSVRSSTFTGNEASSGGAIVTYGEMTLINATISGNMATGNAPGINVNGVESSPPFEVLITNSTIAGNSGPATGGLFLISPNGIVTVTNTIIADNGQDCVNDFDSELDSGGHNLDSDGSCDFDAPGDQANASAGLAPLGNYGGPTQTHQLLASSAAIDAADDVACPDDDQRGVGRPIDGDGDGEAVCDIGAVESEDPIQGASVAWGDWNCSGTSDPVDSLLNLRHDAGLATNTDECPEMGTPVSVLVASALTWGDADCNGTRDPVDSLKILRFDAGLSVSQDEGCPVLGSDVLISEG